MDVTVVMKQSSSGDFSLIGVFSSPDAACFELTKMMQPKKSDIDDEDWTTQDEFVYCILNDILIFEVTMDKLADVESIVSSTEFPSIAKRYVEYDDNDKAWKLFTINREFEIINV